MMSPNIKLATVLIVALGTIGTAATAFAQTTSPGIELADRLLHEATGAGGSEDIRFHQGLCQAGITTEALEELGGCEILPPLGQSAD
jgi:hypothetical protein